MSVASTEDEAELFVCGYGANPVWYSDSNPQRFAGQQRFRMWSFSTQELFFCGECTITTVSRCSCRNLVLGPHIWSFRCLAKSEGLFISKLFEKLSCRWIGLVTLCLLSKVLFSFDSVPKTMLGHREILSGRDLRPLQMPLIVTCHSPTSSHVVALYIFVCSLEAARETAVPKQSLLQVRKLTYDCVLTIMHLGPNTFNPSSLILKAAGVSISICWTHKHSHFCRISPRPTIVITRPLYIVVPFGNICLPQGSQALDLLTFLFASWAKIRDLAKGCCMISYLKR